MRELIVELELQRIIVYPDGRREVENMQHDDPARLSHDEIKKH